MKRMYDENEIKSIASEAGGGKLYKHRLSLKTTDRSTFYGIRISTSPTEFSIEDMTDLSSLINKEACIESSDGLSQIYNLFSSLDDGIYTGKPDQMVLSYYPTYPGLHYATKDFPKTSFENNVTEL